MKGCSKIAMLTVYDYPTACALDRCHLDILFVGDTLGQVELGFDHTSDVTMDMMLHHLSAVRRGIDETHLLVDLPNGSYTDPEQALKSALRLLGAGANSVKLEGPCYQVVEHLVSNGVQVMGHVGLLPQTARKYLRQGTKRKSANRIEAEAEALFKAGCFALVLEYMPSSLARRITSSVKIPTIGIGAGPDCDGQVLVVTDMLGFYPKVPSFVKKYSHIYEEIIRAGNTFREEVKTDVFPTNDSKLVVNKT